MPGVTLSAKIGPLPWWARAFLQTKRMPKVLKRFQNKRGTLVADRPMTRFMARQMRFKIAVVPVEE